MAPVLIPVALAAATAGAGVGLGLVGAGAAVFSVAATAVSAGISYLARPKPVDLQQEYSGAASSSDVATLAPANYARSFPVRQPTPSRRFVYGKVRTAGVIFFEDNSNPYLYIGAVISDGEIEAIDSAAFGDTDIVVDSTGAAVAGTIYAARFNIERALGAPGQVVSPYLAAAFPARIGSTFKQTGVARVVARLHWGADSAGHSTLWGNSIDPVYVVRGVLMYDPREAAHDIDDATTWEYSANPALFVAHILLNAWDISITEADIDWDSVIAAANICDTTITVNGDEREVFVGAGIFEAGTSMAGQVADMLAAMGGSLTFNNGKYYVYADAARTSVWTATDDDILGIGQFQHAPETATVFLSLIHI